MVWNNGLGTVSGARLRYVMVGFMVLLIFTAAGPKCSAQTWAEIFSQKKTQKKYLLNQIAALQVYISYAKKGYGVVSDGLDVVRDISSGEFDLHSAFISGLAKVNPVIAKDVRVAEIVEMQVGVLKSFSALRGSGLLTADQLGYVTEVADGVILNGYHDLSELLLVISSGKLELGDQERLIRLNEIYERMLDKSGFTLSFSAEVRALVRQKSMDKQSLEKLRRVYGIN